jgi:hypothetical protein
MIDRHNCGQGTDGGDAKSGWAHTRSLLTAPFRYTVLNLRGGWRVRRARLARATRNLYLNLAKGETIQNEY